MAPRIGFTIPPELMGRFVRWGKRHRLPAGEAIRQLLECGLDQKEAADHPPRRGAPRRRQVLDIIDAVSDKKAELAAKWRPGLPKVTTKDALLKVYRQWPASLGKKPATLEAFQALYIRCKKTRDEMPTLENLSASYKKAK